MRTNVIKTALVLLCMAASAVAAEQSETGTTENVTSGASSERQVDMQFGGSLCAVCLNAFRTRLLSMTGVKNVDIAVDKNNPKSGHPPKVAHAFIGYDPEQISKANLIETIKRNDFQFLAAKDRSISNSEQKPEQKQEQKEDRKAEHTEKPGEEHNSER